MFGFDCCLAVSSNGRSGGIARFWRNSFNCSILNYSSNHINARFWRNSFNCYILNYSSNHINARVDDPIQGPWQFMGYMGS